MDRYLSKEILESENKTIEQIADISTTKHKGAKMKIPVLYYEQSENPDPLALTQAYEILFEEVLRIRKNKR